MVFPTNPGSRLGTKGSVSAHVKPPWIISPPAGTGSQSFPCEQTMWSGWAVWRAACSFQQAAHPGWDPPHTLWPCCGLWALTCCLQLCVPNVWPRAPHRMCSTDVSGKREEAERNRWEVGSVCKFSGFRDNLQLRTISSKGKKIFMAVLDVPEPSPPSLILLRHSKCVDSGLLSRVHPESGPPTYQLSHCEDRFALR